MCTQKVRFNALKTMLLAAPAAWAVVGCLPVQIRYGGEAGGGSVDSVLTSVTGIEDKDKTRQNIQYTLQCDGATPVEGTLQNDYVKFPAQNLAPGIACSMAIRADALASNVNFRWYAKKGSDFDKGLLYGSSKGKLGDDKKLNLDLYRTYSEVGETDTFSATFAVKFDLGSATMPTNLVPQLVCDGVKSTQPGQSFKVVSGTTDQAILGWDRSLNVLQLNGKSCSKLVLMNGTEEKWAASLNGFKFGDLDSGETYNYGQKNPYVMTASTVTPPRSSDTAVAIIGGKPCINYSSDQKTCNDETRAFALKWDKRYILAKVKGAQKKSAGSYDKVETYLVTAGDGVGLHQGDFSVQVLNSDKAKYSWWKPTAESLILGAKFDEALVKATTLASEKQSLPPDFEVMHVEWVQVHGFHDVTNEDLNSPLRSSARWLVMLKRAGDTAQIPKHFIAAGHEKFFSPQKFIDNGKAFFGKYELIDDLKNGQTDRFRAYGMLDGLLAPNACSVQSIDYVQSISQQYEETIEAPGGTPCSVGSTQLTASGLAAGDFEAFRWLVWEWFQAEPAKVNQ